jgi:hypothetical protein
LFMELRVARKNGFSEIKLDSVAHMVEEYKKKGYAVIPNSQYDDPLWGNLTLMSKRP